MRSNRRDKGVRLTARDTQIFEDLLERRADSLGSIHARHWPGAAHDTARRRLGVLVNDGFLNRIYMERPPASLVHPADDESGWVHAYTLTPRGVAALRRRSLAGSVLRGRSVKGDLDEAAIPHQLAVNRVGELLGTALRPDHLIELVGDRRHRPDATYQARPDSTGRRTVMLEVDLGHYSRQRILGKLSTFLADPDAAGVLFACPTDERAAWIARTLRAAHGDRIMDRVQVLTFTQIQEGRLLRDALRPDPDTDTTLADVYDYLPHAA